MNNAMVPTVAIMSLLLLACIQHLEQQGHPPQKGQGKRAHRSGRCDAVAAAQVQFSQRREACHRVQREAGAPRRFQAGEVDAREANLAAPQGKWSAEVANGRLHTPGAGAQASQQDTSRCICTSTPHATCSLALTYDACHSMQTGQSSECIAQPTHGSWFLLCTT